MAYKFSTQGGYGIGASVFHYNALHPDRVDIPDAELLFRGHFARSGPDLILTGQDGQRHIVPSYFAIEKHPDLVAPNGAHLSADVVDLLAGSPTPGQYVQAHTVLPPEAIGKVEKVVGNVTVLRNGTAVTLHVGDPVHKSDVIETAANSSCGIVFPDGTALDVVAGTRMALNEYTYDVAGASNSALFTLVEGTFAFVAGQVAHSGDGMKITTPVATMGIRGTVGLFKSEPTVVNSRLGHVWSVVLHEDLDGSHHLGRIAIIDHDPTSPAFGQVIYLLDSSEYIAYLEPQGSGLPPHVRVEPITSSRQFDDRHFYDDLNQIISAYNGANPPSGPNGGSGDNPNLSNPTSRTAANRSPSIFNPTVAARVLTRLSKVSVCRCREVFFPTTARRPLLLHSQRSLLSKVSVCRCREVFFPTTARRPLLLHSQRSLFGTRAGLATGRRTLTGTQARRRIRRSIKSSFSPVP